MGIAARGRFAACWTVPSKQGTPGPTGAPRPLRIAILAGRPEGYTHAIADYAELLAEALREAGVEVLLVVREGWGARDWRGLRGELRAWRPDFVHIQYPSAAFGQGFVPQALAGEFRSMVTLHEGEAYGPIVGRQRVLPYYLFSRRLVFATEHERAYAVHWAPWVRRKSTVIPIASNIAARPEEVRTRNEVLSFSAIVPHRGIEQLIEMARLIQARGLPWRVRLIGGHLRGFERYEARLREETAGLPFEWLGRLPADEVAAEIGRAGVMYLPYPDGASERRATLLAAFGGGAAVVTSTGARTTPGIRAAIAPAETPEEALGAIAHLFEDDAERARLSGAGLAYAAPFTWERIAAAHVSLYKDALRR